ncbi:hypothetical protein SMACR_01856 [Sordaria macrospora]|uniref:WGS project CABT00000000 data, contig 2.5 n=2 Tax=Sordaria macrospora TaxID=5147 RepID=F7VS22_SORMK|nr:uncharacterized protein SMAC_01856 [Sordaria macrospora k-hell]KAA8636549.1 hypothetical protein SMACR_01856 [Sordaria macrospora]WPJ61548.1 hypothetical protein SMAC4_01856 [Sordaria macrospora]CCC08308.1 unnamed protein product [Sordaria macrospora k-hell]
MEENDKPVFERLHVPKCTREPILHYLRNWKGLAKDFHKTAPIRKAAAQQRQRAKMQQMVMGIPPEMSGFDDMTPTNCELDRDFFDNLGFLPPPDSIAPSVEPALVPLLDACDDGKPGGEKALKAYLDANWKVNVTLIDMEWEKEWRVCEPDHGEADVTPFVHFDPIEVLGHLSAHLPIGQAKVHKDENAIGLISAFFDLLTDTLYYPNRPEMTVEVVLGEMTDFMERLRYNCLEYRSQAAEDGFDPRKFPRAYDRIHLSNVTDYVGGLMNPLLFAAPLLKEPGSSDVRFTVLLNPPKFKTHEQFQAEYALMPSEANITNHFHLKRVPPPPPSMSHPLGSFFEESYFVWQLQPGEKLPWEKLMARPQLERLISQLHELGYPAHWVSGILSSICEGTITTTTRAPTAEVITPQELVFWDVSQGKPPRKLRTLLSDDEVGDGSAAAQAIRNKGIRVVSAFRYMVDTESVNFWLRKDIVDGMLSGPG